MSARLLHISVLFRVLGNLKTINKKNNSKNKRRRTVTVLSNVWFPRKMHEENEIAK